LHWGISRKIKSAFASRCGVWENGGMDSDDSKKANGSSAGGGNVPAANDLAGWKEVDRRLAGRMIEKIKGDARFKSSRAVRLYFGRNDLEHFINAHLQRGVGEAYTSWCVLFYRPHREAKTRGQEMLESGLPRAEELLLRARMSAHASIHRVARADAKAGTVDLEDVLLGGTMRVHDRMMAEHVQEGLFVSARVFQAGEFRFLELAGPPLGIGMGMEAVEFLREEGMEFTREGLLRDVHLFGRLWEWIDDWQANWRPPRLANTDGDELLWHMASFSVKDEGKVRKLIERREDVDFDRNAGQYVWFRDNTVDPKIAGDTVSLGRIEFVGDELVLNVNSAKRLATARKWLEKLPGVVFRKVVTRKVDAPAKERPGDERMPQEPVKMTPELLRAVREMMNKQYMGWLDKSIPALGGKTPREACRTAAGREQVAILIRTIPNPMGPGEVEVPREAMLRELGIVKEQGPGAA
jgi:hypothetical protein